jgi:hypothetical protein
VGLFPLLVFLELNWILPQTLKKKFFGSVAEEGELIYPSEDLFEEEKPFLVGLALFFLLFFSCVLLPPGRCREGFRSLQKGRWKQGEEEHLTHLGVLGAFLVFFCFFFCFLLLSADFTCSVLVGPVAEGHG